jgi:hypothetical protein
MTSENSWKCYLESDTIRVTLGPGNIVMVKAFVFDAIHQESYWITPILKKFSDSKSAEQYASRMAIELNPTSSVK